MSISFSEFKDSELSSTKHYLVVGNPISHSLSPLMHNIALKSHNLEGTYYAVELLEQDLQSFAAHLNSDFCLGVNITIPYKSQLLPFVDKLDESVDGIGVINTIYKDNQQLIGANTDAYGFAQALLDFEDDISGERAILFGSGGASKAVIKALEDLSLEEVIIVSRSRKGYAPTSNVNYVSYDEWVDYAEDTTLIINSTPLGMKPDYDTSPVKDHEVHLLEDKISYDLVYNPIETKFLYQSKQVGAETISGLDMLIHQGSRAFEFWTGKTFPIEEIRRELIDVLS